MRRSPPRLSLHLLPLVLVLLAALAAAHIDRRLASNPATERLEPALVERAIPTSLKAVSQHLAVRASGFLADELEGEADAATTLAGAHVSSSEDGSASRSARRKREIGRRGHDWEVLRKRVELDGKQRGLFE
jgi:hypothetical protein